MKKAIITLLIILIIFGSTLGAIAYDFILTVPDAHVIEIRDAICAYYEYDLTKKPEETKKVFVERMCRKHFIKEKLIIYRVQQRYKIARDEIQAEVDAMNLE